MLRTLLVRAALLVALLGLSSLAAAQATYLPTGVQQSVPVTTVTSGGWTECHRALYGATGTSVASVLAACGGDRLMLACRQTGSPTLSVLAQAPRADVIFDTGTSNVTRQANGVSWYYSPNYSWGFAPGGQPVTRGSCDTTNTGNNDRICYHTGAGNMNGGWRCGSATGLNSSVAYEKVIYTANDGATVPGAPTSASAVAGDAQATVSFTAPASDGGSVITGYRVTSSPGGVVATGAGSPITVTGLNNGTSYTFTVVAINALGDSVASAPSNAVVPKGTPTLSGFGDIARTWGDPDFALVAPTSDSDGAFSYVSDNPAVATVSGSTITLTGVGSAQITANQAEGSAHLAGSISATLTVSPADPAISWMAPIGKTFGDADFALDAPTSNSAGAFSYGSDNPAVATVSGNVVTITGAGSATLTVNQAADANYEAGSATVSLTVAKAVPTLGWMAPISKTFGDADFALDAPTSSSTGALVYSSDNPAVATVSGNVVTITGAGSATLTVNQAADANYEAGSATVSLTVAKAVPTLGWMAPISKTFGDADFALDAPTTPSTGALSYSSDTPSVATVSGNLVSITGAGTATLTVSQAADDNYEAGSATVSLSVDKATPTLTWMAPISRTFGDAAFALDTPSSPGTGAFTYSSDNPAVATVSGNTVTITGAGSATLTALQAADANYEAASITVTLTVAKAQPVLAWMAPISKTFGDADFALDPPATPSTGALSYSSDTPSVATVSGNLVSIAGAGTATLTVSQAADANYEAASATTTLTVGQAAPVISWTAAIDKTWGDPAFDLPAPSSNSTGAFSYSSDNPAVATVSGNTVTITGAGTANITASQAADANYLAGSASLVLTVGKAAPALDWIGDIAKTYGEADFDLPDPQSPSPGAFSFASDNAAVATVSGRTVTITGAGAATLTVTQAETANFQAASASLQLLVNARPDPREDPTVVAGLQAQVDASVRFASAQQMNIRDRLRQVRSGSNGNSNGVALNMASGFGPGLGLSANALGDAQALALPEGWGWWTAGAITFGDRSPGGVSGDFGFHSDGVTLGFDRRIGERTLLGVAFGMGWNDTDFDGNSSSLSGRQRALSVYGLWRGDRWFVDGLLGHGELDFDIRRYSSLVNGHARATRSGDQLFGSVTLGYEHATDQGRLVGYARLDGSRSQLDAYRETGLGIYDLSYTRQTVENTGLSLGVEGGRQWLTSSGVMRPYWMAEYRFASEDQSDVGINYVVLPNATDYVLGLRSYAGDALTWGGGIDLEISARWGLSLIYRGERVDGGDNSYGFGLMLNYRGDAPAAAVQPGEPQAGATPTQGDVAGKR